MDGLEALGTQRAEQSVKASSSKKPKVVNLGKRSFKISKPGVFKARAQAAGLSTKAAAQKWKGEDGERGNQARSAIGLMAMGK